MRKFALLLLSVGGLLSACVAYEVPGRDGRTYYGDGDRYYSDRDRDRVPNRLDSHPDDPRRY